VFVLLYFHGLRTLGLFRLRHLCRSSYLIFRWKLCLHKTSVERPEVTVITLCCGGFPGFMVVRLYIFLYFFWNKMFGWYHSARYFQFVIHNRDSISYFESQDSVVSIAARLRVEIFWVHGQEFFLFSKTSRPAPGHTDPPVQWVPQLFPPR
jgi:hypothetical protein